MKHEVRRGAGLAVSRLPDLAGSVPSSRTGFGVHAHSRRQVLHYDAVCSSLAVFFGGQRVSDSAEPVSYEGVPTGVPLLSSTGQQFGTLEKVLEIPSEDLFDGVIVKTDHGRRFVDRDQIIEITTKYIRCSLSDNEAADLPEPSGTAAYDADTTYGVGNSFREWVHRMFGHGGWRAEK
jgi:hypothetical protein